MISTPRCKILLSVRLKFELAFFIQIVHVLLFGLPFLAGADRRFRQTQTPSCRAGRDVLDLSESTVCIPAKLPARTAAQRKQQKARARVRDSGIERVE